MHAVFPCAHSDTISPDEIGLDLPDLETAYLEAFKAAEEMWSELLVERSDRFGRTFEIADEHDAPFSGGIGTCPQAKESTTLLRKQRMLIDSLQEKIRRACQTIETTQKTI